MWSRLTSLNGTGSEGGLVTRSCGEIASGDDDADEMNLVADDETIGTEPNQEEPSAVQEEYHPTAKDPSSIYSQPHSQTVHSLQTTTHGGYFETENMSTSSHVERKNELSSSGDVTRRTRSETNHSKVFVVEADEQFAGVDDSSHNTRSYTVDVGTYKYISYIIHFLTRSKE